MISAHVRHTAIRGLSPLVALALAGVLSGCAESGSAPAAHRRVRVIAGENFWGSIAAQLAGNKASVESIIVNPSTDPHSYQPSSGDARGVAESNMVIENGIGYDRWLAQLLGASGEAGRVVLNVGRALGLREGANPHQWYSPRSVYRVIDEIVAGYDRLDPADSTYFASQKRSFETVGLARYNALRSEIRSRYAGVAVGYSESIFRPLGEDLGLRLATPYSFARAIAEGTDVSAQDKETVDSQAERRQISVWVYNSQNATPDVQRVTALAAARHIPTTTVTETLAPAGDSFQQWQVAELERLKQALRRATGR